MPLDRTWYIGLVDDDQSNTVGTVWNKAAVDSLMDAVDAELVDTVPAVLTTTGLQHNWAPGLHGDTLTRWAGASDLTVTGMAGGVAGQRWRFRNTGTAVAYFGHNNGSSLFQNRLWNTATSQATPVAPGGSLTYEHDGTQWYLLTHEQGAWITPTYSGANFTSNAGSWTVDAADVTTYAYRLSGKTLMVSWYLQSTSVTGTPTVLRVAVPNGFTITKAGLFPLVHDDAGAGNAGSFCLVNPGGTVIENYKAYGASAFANATNTTRLFSTITFEVN
jgi:hypothetical protein